MYAVIDDRNEQHTVRAGDVILCDLNAALTPGDSLTFDKVLMIGDEGTLKLGKPYVDGAAVNAEILGEAKGVKVVSFRFKRRKNVRVKKGHRQRYTRIRITEINA